MIEHMFAFQYKSFKMNHEQDTSSLIEIRDGQTGTIVSILGGRSLIKRLADLGLTTGTEIKVIGRTLFTGPVQIEACGSKLAISRGLASKIMVTLK